MLKSSLLEIIRTFTKQDLIKFEDFVRSPYFNKKDNVLKLFLEIKKYDPEFTDANLEKEKIWVKVFPEKEYNYGIMKNLIFDLNKLIEQFMIDLKLSRDEFRKTEYLMNSLLDRDLNKIFINKFKSLSEIPDIKNLNFGNLNISDQMDYINKMYFIKLYYHHQYEQNFNPEELMDRKDSFLISGFLVKLFGAFNDSFANCDSRKSDIQKKTVTKLLELISPGMKSITESIRKTSAINSDYVNIYFAMYNTLIEKTEQRYIEFKNIVAENLNILPKSNIQALHHCLATAVKFTEFKNLNKNREMMEILDSMIEHNTITELRNDKIPVHIFTTYTSLCKLFSDSVKLKTFSERYLDKLDPEVRKNTGIHVKFMISFIDKSYNEALHYLSMLDIPYVFLKTTLRLDKAKCLYETDNYEIFLNEQDSMKHFLNNKLVLEREKKSLLLRFSTIKKLFELKHNFDKYEFKKLRVHIEENFKNNTGNWFIEKLEEIEQLKVKS